VSFRVISWIVLYGQYQLPHYAFRARRKSYEVSVVKAMMDLVGLVDGPVRPPLVNVADEEVKELKQMLETWEPVL
jgi:5-dehydro-4-deoxyglucarate dehydratase